MNVDTNSKYRPSIKDQLLLPKVGDARINANGTRVAFLKAFSNLRDNFFEVYCYIYDIKTESTYQMTKTGVASTIRWVDENTLALRKKTEKSFQLFVYEDLIGEGVQITDHPGGIEIFEPFANGFVFLAERSSPDLESRKQKYGDFINVEEEKSLSSLYYIDYNKFKTWKQLARDPKTGEIQISIEISKILEEPLKIESFFPSTALNQIFINSRSRDDLVFEDETRCFKISINPNTIFDKDMKSSGEVQQIPLPKGARIKAISPDGSKLLVSHKERELKQYIQSDLWIVDLKSSKLHLQCITQDFDQEPLQAFWSKSGIYVRFWNESTQKLARISELGNIEIIDLQDLSIDSLFFVNDKGILSFLGNSPTSYTDIYLGFPYPNSWKLKRITENYEKIMTWDLGTVESIRWVSKDGTEIEGVLHKPSDFDPQKKYPLLFQVHGGPAASSPKCLLQQFDLTYPTIQLVNKDILVLKPNYRGSVGRGQSFLSLNVDNMGVGDMWDLESAIDHLVAQGYVDETKIGSMGWSQGGYISAFVAMHSNRFKAVSAGAALSSWYTYFSGSDNRQSYCLTDNPFKNKDLYEKTAPISGINTAQTPIMFQHGENDRRVPLTSALEMFRALKEKGVKTSLFIYPGMGHGWLKPRENYAVMVQNYRWFMHHLLDEKLDFFKDDEEVPLESENNEP